MPMITGVVKKPAGAGEAVVEGRAGGREEEIGGAVEGRGVWGGAEAVVDVSASVSETEVEEVEDEEEVVMGTEVTVVATGGPTAPMRVVEEGASVSSSGLTATVVLVIGRPTPTGAVALASGEDMAWS
jgi:hypothetical protein